ncbi:MAG: hypothetical protein QOE34_2630 [Verrucomicrobiota bacterium]|jgi:hypothetical protein
MKITTTRLSHSCIRILLFGTVCLSSPFLFARKNVKTCGATGNGGPLDDDTVFIQAAGKIAVLTLTSYGPDGTDLVASMTMQE